MHLWNAKNSVRLRVATIDDSTGSVRLQLWNSQADLVSIGDYVEIRNASVGTFRGSLQIFPAKRKSGLIIIKTSTQKEENPPLVEV